MNKDPYLDDNGVLINLLGLTDEKELDRAEEDISYLKLLNIDSILPEKCDYEHMLAIHKHIFGDIYEWAGRIRIIPIVKGERVLGGDTVRYSHPENIERDAKIVIDDMNAVDWLSLSNRDKAERMTKLIARLWQTHPFREGNTRTIINFMIQLAETKGFKMDVDLFKNNPKYTRNALVKASDGEYSDYQYLVKIIEDSIDNESN